MSRLMMAWGLLGCVLLMFSAVILVGYIIPPKPQSRDARGQLQKRGK